MNSEENYEVARILALKSYDILDTPAQQTYDDITLLASQICNVPIALISLIDENRQWFKSKVGLEANETPREFAFCAHAIQNPNELFIISNAMDDNRFNTNPLVLSDPNIRFYCGAPLVTDEGYALGTLCVIDREPRVLNPQQLAALEALRRNVVTAFELKKSLKELKISENKNILFTSIVESSNDAILSLDLDGNILTLNKGAELIFGYSKNDIIGKNISILYPDNVVVDENDILDKIKSGQKIKHFETIRKRNDGKLIDISLTISPILNSENEIIGASLIARNISEKKKYEKQLKENEAKLIELNATKDKFFSIVAHDLRGPLGNVKTLISFLDENYTDYTDIEKQDIIKLISESSILIYSFLENLLEWANSQKGTINFDPQSVNLKILTISVLNLMNPIAKTKNIEISNDLFNDVYMVGDVNMVNTILRNLISNAIKFTPNNGKIKIKSDYKDGEVICSICDSGVGISKDNLKKLFRIDSTITSIGTNNEKGTGLGLILCKEFVEKHTGKIWVESEIGKGSTFYFTLPKIT